jgi:hypothetical protein
MINFTFSCGEVVKSQLKKFRMQIFIVQTTYHAPFIWINANPTQKNMESFNQPSIVRYGLICQFTKKAKSI